MAFTSTIYKLGFEISPVILTGGVAQAIPGGMLPIVTLTQASSLLVSAFKGNLDNVANLDKYFCHWKVQQGSTLLDYELARYPFANQKVAANALLAQPLNIPMVMEAPVNESNGVFTKLATFTALQATLEAHSNLGGSYIVATPAQIFTNCLLRKVQDITPGSAIVPQRQWLFLFEKPLISETDAERATNSYLSSIDQGNQQASSSWTNVTAALGNTALGSTVTNFGDDIVGLISKLSGV